VCVRALLLPINRALRHRFSEEKAQAWIEHRFEEVGQLEYLWPGLTG
jgi:hypothetical protein